MFPRVSFFSFSFLFVFLHRLPGETTFLDNDEKEQVSLYIYIYIYSIRSLQFRVSMCSAELDASSNVHPRSKLGKAHDPLDLSNSRETVGKEVLREVYFA